MRGEGRRHHWAIAALVLLALAAPTDAAGPPPQLRSVDPASGPTGGGNEVTLSGKHLSEASSLRFGDTEVEFQDIGNDKLTAVSPPHAAGVVQITVTTPRGSGSIDFEYTADPPAIDTLTPGQGSTQGGQDVTISGSGLAGTTAVRFGSADAASFEVVDDGEVRAVTPPHAAGTVDLAVETPRGTATKAFTFVATTAISGLDPDQGSTEGGGEVTIHGSGLAGTTAVRFGSADAASFEVVDDGGVRAVTPPHAAGTVELRVETPEGSATHSFTFVDADVPVVIDQLTPASGPTEGGTHVTITGEGLSHVTRVTFGGTEAASWTPESDVRLVAVTPSHAAGTVQVALQHAGGTAVASFTYEAADPPPSEPSSPPQDTRPTTQEKEGLQSVPDPVQTGAPADVVRSGAAIDSCWVLLAASAPGHRIVVPFPESCEVEAVVVEVPAAAGLLNISVHLMKALPEDVPSPGIVRGPGLIFAAEIRDMEGQEVDPAGAVLQVRMPGAWLDECPPEACATDLFHYDGDVWSVHSMRTVDRFDGFLVMQADVSSFSLFAVGGTPLATVDGSAASWLWAWLVGGVAMVGAPTAVTVWRRRTAPPEDPKVGMLLREMSDKEELLQFLNNAAHDLANPLTPIQLQLDLLVHAADTTDPEEQRRALRLVQQNVEQMTMLVGDLRDAAKVRSGRLRFFPAQHDLGGVLGEAAAMVETQAARAEVSLTYESPGREVPVRIDRGRILQVVTNLLGNAIKFTPAGGRVVLAMEADEGTATVRVTDTGLGMTPEGQDALFQPFSQSHGDAEKAKGTGLGLYIAKGIVEAHDGKIGCHSDGPGQGSTFWFTLPLDAL